MRVTPTFREGSPGFVVCVYRGAKAKQRQADRETIPGLWMYYTAVTDGYVFPRGQSQSASFGRMDFILRYFRRLFITVVSYCRASQRSVKRGSCFFCRARKQTGSRKAIDIHLKHNISYLLRLIKRYINRPTEFTHNTCRFAFKDQSGSLGLARCAILCFPG